MAAYRQSAGDLDARIDADLVRWDAEKAAADRPVVARTIEGDEVGVTVHDKACLICLASSDGHDLIMAPDQAQELALRIIERLYKRRRGEVGPFSASF